MQRLSVLALGVLAFAACRDTSNEPAPSETVAPLFDV